MALLTVKLAPELEAQLQARASQEELSKSELVRRALWAYLAQQPCSAPKQRPGCRVTPGNFPPRCSQNRT